MKLKTSLVCFVPVQDVPFSFDYIQDGKRSNKYVNSVEMCPSPSITFGKKERRIYSRSGVATQAAA
jgi:hypothetical protein